jgi:hypothetical protein
MKSALNEIKNKFCSFCKLGSPSLLIGYKSSGTCLDYAFKKLNVPYAFAWEIFSNEEPFPEMQKALGSFSFLQARKSNLEFKMKFVNNLDSNVRRSYSQSENEICFNLFNPKNKRQYDFINTNWSKAMNTLFLNLLNK